MNKSILIGRLTRDPSLKYTQSGTAITEFTIAVDRRKKDDGADFIPVVCFQKTAEAVANFQRKGSLVGVEGRINVRHYEKDGKRIYVTEVLADDVRFLEPPKTNSGSSAPSTPAEDLAPWETDDFPL